MCRELPVFLQHQPDQSTTLNQSNLLLSPGLSNCISEQCNTPYPHSFRLPFRHQCCSHIPSLAIDKLSFEFSNAINSKCILLSFLGLNLSYFPVLRWRPCLSRPWDEGHHLWISSTTPPASLSHSILGDSWSQRHQALQLQINSHGGLLVHLQIPCWN